MEQKRLYKTIAEIASEQFASEEALLIEVLSQLVDSVKININGGRIYKLNPKSESYELVHQMGKVKRIKKNFSLLLKEYPLFKLVTEERTILATETNRHLVEKGIIEFSASGIGDKLDVGDDVYFEYLLSVSSKEMIDSEVRYVLNIVATVLTSKIRERRISTSRKNLIDDIDKAKHLMRSILPEHEYQFNDYDIFGITIPAEIVGGDFYDYIKVGDEEERIGIALGDAASKGLSASAEAMYISGALRMAGNFQMKISPMMKRMNELVNKIFSDDKFSTLFYCEISNDKKGLLLFANAGHNPPMFVEKKNKKITYLNPTGPLLGPAPNSKYETDSINFSSGDVLVIFSDGITEAANDKFQFYEEKRLEKVIKKNVDLCPKKIALKIIDDVVKFSTSNSKYQDDKTVVVIKRN
ncbi:MAG: serine/threonine-protein phosphatase [Ignavibacteriae bacterium]|nr:serine/threonine-protein phosphatase [Ignavibacteriota bacterium]